MTPFALIAKVEQCFAFCFCVLEMTREDFGICSFKIVTRIFLLGLQKHIAIRNFAVTFEAVKVEIIYILNALHIHCETFKSVCQFTCNW